MFSLNKPGGAFRYITDTEIKRGRTSFPASYQVHHKLLNIADVHIVVLTSGSGPLPPSGRPFLVICDQLLDDGVGVESSSTVVGTVQGAQRGAQDAALGCSDVKDKVGRGVSAHTHHLGSAVAELICYSISELATCFWDCSPGIVVPIPGAPFGSLTV